MNRHSIITAVSIIVIAVVFAHAGWNIFAVSQLEYRWDGPGNFSFFALSNNGKMEFCNPMPYWTSFQKFEIATFYDSRHLGSFVVAPLTVDPYSSTIHKGTFTTDEFLAAQHVFMTLDFEFDGGDIRLDPNKMIVVVHAETPIMGVIPYSSSTTMSGFEFDGIMNTENLSCS